MTPKLRIAAITDEFSPDLEPALNAMEKIGMTGAELRVLWGKNIMDLSRDELNRARDLIQGKNMQVMSLASPILKCVLPNAPGSGHPIPAGHLRLQALLRGSIAFD